MQPTPNPENRDPKKCPHCGGTSVTRKGVRKTKSGITQLYACLVCSRRFSLSPLPFFTYPAEAVLYAPVLYHQGFSLQEVRKRIHRKFNLSPSLAAVANWVGRFGRFAAMKEDRSAIREYCGPAKVIKRRLLNHRQQYLFQTHAYKLEKINPEFAALKRYLQRVHDNSLPIDPEHFSLRGSKIELEVPGPLLVEAQKENYASKVAGLALKAAKCNGHRHAAVQKFFLAMDRDTVAVEVPVYLTSGETSRILFSEGGLLGHIDFLQATGSGIVILDYKPEASKEKRVIQQLLSYAVALSVRTEIHLGKITCVWFDEKEYFRFQALDAYINFKNLRNQKIQYKKEIEFSYT